MVLCRFCNGQPLTAVHSTFGIVAVRAYKFHSGPEAEPSTRKKTAASKPFPFLLGWLLDLQCHAESFINAFRAGANVRKQWTTLRGTIGLNLTSVLFEGLIPQSFRESSSSGNYYLAAFTCGFGSDYFLLGVNVRANSQY